jgi:hypothetical protein
VALGRVDVSGPRRTDDAAIWLYPEMFINPQTTQVYGAFF